MAAREALAEPELVNPASTKEMTVVREQLKHKTKRENAYCWFGETRRSEVSDAGTK